MSFGATFGDEAEPDEEPQVASSGHYLAQQRRLNFEAAWTAHEAGSPSMLGKDFIEEVLRDVAAGVLTITEEQRAWIAAEALASQDESAENPTFGPSSRDWRLDAHAANQARAAAQTVHPSIGELNIVLTLADAWQVFAYRGLNALSKKLKKLADRFEPLR